MNTNTTPPVADDLSAIPRYRTTGERWAAVNGIAHPPGTEFDAKFWPRWPVNTMGNLEAVNEPARRILRYLNKFKFGYPIIESLWSDQHDRYWLPEPGNDYRSSMIRVVGEADILPGMPKYRALTDFHESQHVPDRPFPHRRVNAGDEFCVLTWPDRLSEHLFEPANAEAEEVWDYWHANRDNPRIQKSPWCWFHLAIFLPELAGVRRVPAVA